MKMMYDVTIGIPVFQSANFIRQTMESALAQSYPSIEFLVVDDCGNDGSLQIVEDFQQTHVRGCDIHIIRNEVNKGVSASRNRIIDEAQGNYLFFLDSDDLMSENTIEILMRNLLKYDAEIVFGSYERVGLADDRQIYQYPDVQFLREDELATFAYRKYAGIQASACNYLVKTSLLRDHNHRFIDTNYWEDLVFTFDLVTFIKRAVLLPDITYYYICREGSLSNYQSRLSVSKEEILRNVHTIDHLKATSSLLSNKVYYPQRCYNIVMTDFYIVSNVLKHRKKIVPFVSNREIRQIMAHPAKFCKICSFRTARLSNLLLFLLGKLPPSLCVWVIWCMGTMKRLINNTKSSH